MISEKMSNALNKQVNAELYSAYLYLSMEAYFHSQNLPGFANWMHVQTQEEVTHAMKIYDYLVDRGAMVTLTAIDGPPVKWKSPLDAFENVCRHEAKVTNLINCLADLAVVEKDHAANMFLQWFVNEQVEEEKNAAQITANLKLVADAPAGLFMLDKELAARVFTAPAQAQGE